jgi:hypothetical protein
MEAGATAAYNSYEADNSFYGTLVAFDSLLYVPYNMYAVSYYCYFGLF